MRRSSLCLSLLSMTEFLACQQSPVIPVSSGFDAVASSATTKALNGQGTLTTAKPKPVLECFFSSLMAMLIA
jgi:hypothetical protein